MQQVYRSVCSCPRVSGVCNFSVKAADNFWYVCQHQAYLYSAYNIMLTFIVGEHRCY